jgi:glycine betaine/choline ABC-type transport system substrate-binding protein
LNTSAIDVGQLCTTQPEVVTYNLVVLEDDLGMHPVNNMAPVLTQDLADAGGDLLESTLNAISAELTTEDLTNLYYSVAVDGQDLADVAQTWLEDKGLLSAGGPFHRPMVAGPRAGHRILGADG